MKSVSNSKISGMTAFRRRLIPVGFALAVCVGGPTAALAQLQTYYHVGVWDAFSGRTDKGNVVCGIGNTNPTNNRRFSISFDIGGADTVFAVSKPGWSIPGGTHIAVVMQVGLNTPMIVQATGHEQTIDWRMDHTALQPFNQQFRGASSMTLTFPDGNEPPWTINLTGSSAITDAFGRCINDLTRQVQAQQASGNNSPVPQGPAAGSTQPFSIAPSASSAEAPAPAPQPAPSQPDATQPGATQPAH